MNTQAKKSKKICLCSMAIVLIAVIGTQSAFAAGLMNPVNGSASDVLLKSHHVNVTINNGFARTEVDQIFHNKSSVDLETVYSFPIPKDASLSELSLWINGKEVIGEVLEKNRARQVYTQETTKRIDPALAEKNSHKTFEITVFPVTANADTRLRLVYYQPIEIDSNIGRYVYPLAGGGSDDDRNAFWSLDEKVRESFKFDLTLKSAFPIAQVRLPGYESTAEVSPVQAEQGSIYNVTINSLENNALNKDVVVYYKLDENVPARVELIPYRKSKKDTGTFMLVVTPAADLKKISEGSDWTFLIDTSGSMRGKNLSMLTEGVTQTIEKMNPDDRFRVIAFSGMARDVTKGYLKATPENIEKAKKKLASIKAGGGTGLHAGLKAAYSKLAKDRTTGVVLVTDAIAELEQKQYSDFLRLLEEFDVRLFSFILGNGGDQSLMERLSRDSGGFTMNVSQADDIIGRIMQAKSHILYEKMHDVEVNFKGVNVTNITPAYYGSLYRGQQMIVFGQYKKSGKVEIEMKAKVSGADRTFKCTANLPEVDTDNPELERLWALSRIDEIVGEIRDEGETPTLRGRIIELGTEYSLVTDYTSMLVLMEDRFQRYNIERKNNARVANERAAQQTRAAQPVKNYRVDKSQSKDSSGNTGNSGTFKSRRSPGIGTGSGPVGPVLLGLIMIARRKKQKKQ